MGTTYNVTIDLKTVGSLDFGKGASHPAKVIDSVKDGWKDLRSVGSGVMGVLDNAVDKMLAIGKAGAIAGGAAGAGAIYYGVKDLNNELESTRIALGTIFSANGVAASVPQGMAKASDVIKEMRQDAKALPGEFDDLKTIFTTGAIDAFRTGATPESWEKLSAKVMAASKVAQVPTEVAAREFAQLMEGRAGAHNVLGTRLFGLSGGEAKKFNAMSDEARYAALSKTLDKYSGSIDEFGKSFDGLESSLIDNAKNLLRQATEPLFNAVKGEMSDVNGWFEQNEGTLENWAAVIGNDLVNAFAWGKEEIELWEPAVEAFASNAYQKLKEIWVEVGPTVKAIGEEIRQALKDPGTLDKLIHLLELWATLKVGGSVVDTVGATVKGASGAYDIYKSAKGFLGAGESAKGLVGGGSSLLGAFGAGGAASYGLAAALPTALAGGLYYGAFGGVKTQEDHDDDATAAGKAMANKQWDDAVAAGKSVTDIMRESRDEIAYMNANFQTVTATAYDLQIAANYAAHALLVAGGNFEAGPKVVEDMQLQNFTDFAKVFNLRGSPQPSKKAAPVGGGHGGMSIQKVEIVVTSNQNPSRVARTVFEEMGKIARNPRSSSHVTNYAALKSST